MEVISNLNRFAPLFQSSVLPATGVTVWPALQLYVYQPAPLAYADTAGGTPVPVPLFIPITFAPAGVGTWLLAVAQSAATTVAKLLLIKRIESLEVISPVATPVNLIWKLVGVPASFTVKRQ